MKGNNLTEEAVAAIFDYSRRQIDYYKTTGPTPRVVALACRGFEAEKQVGAAKAISDAMQKQYARKSGAAA
jgi:hypothetical protein